MLYDFMEKRYLKAVKIRDNSGLVEGVENGRMWFNWYRASVLQDVKWSVDRWLQIMNIFKTTELYT